MFRATQKPKNTVELEFDYNATFIEELKKRIPHTRRVYDPATHVWTVMYSFDLIRWLRRTVKHFFTSAYWSYEEEGELIEENLITGEKSRTESLFSS